MLEYPLLKPKDLRVHMDTPYAGDILCEYFYTILSEIYVPSQVIVLCIGTDRSTGDSLGPLVGEKLKKICSYAKVFGDLAKPVHAGNLAAVLEEINRLYRHPFIIAVDASLGRAENVGTIKIARGALKPGAGVNKDLPPVGHFHITGVVNVGGFMEYLVLQNTRLFVVMKMADIICEGIMRGFAKFFG